jgi:hypothetical protein
LSEASSVGLQSLNATAGTTIDRTSF